ncbi:MAG: aminoacyl-tRNA hydrolase [Dehalococcoidia bacterium]|nr:aminoacyl-tRNA hydrolase [Dehalococcoidia bacterium]
MSAGIGAVFERLFPRRPVAGQPAGRAAPWVIVGLGNPGREYEDTRHNVGQQCVELMARRSRVKLERVDRRARLAETQIEGQPAVLAVPRTFVNDSGVAVRYVLTRSRASPEKLIVILDELNLDPGAVRIRRSGSPGGHNGMKSIVASIGSEEFIRVRIGVGRPPSAEKQIEHVLSPFSRNDRTLVDQAIASAADAAAAIVRYGVEAAMNRWN